MRMKLYRVEIEREHGIAKSYIVAPTEQRAAEVVIDHDIERGQKHLSFSLERVDKTLQGDRRVGLEDILQTAPVGFASYCDAIGWIVHTASMPKLRFFRIEDEKGENTFVVAPDAAIASALYVNGSRLAKGERRLFKILDGVADLPEERVRNLPDLLEFGPVGIADFSEEHGWLVW